MRFLLNTDDYESISLEITDEEYENGTIGIIQEFGYALASFIVDVALKLDCDTEQAKGLKKVLLDIVGRDVDDILDNSVFEELEEEDTESMDELTERLISSGFSDEEIANIKSLVVEFGGVENALEHLKNIAVQNGLNMDDDSCEG